MNMSGKWNSVSEEGVEGQTVISENHACKERQHALQSRSINPQNRRSARLKQGSQRRQEARDRLVMERRTINVGEESSFKEEESAIRASGSPSEPSVFTVTDEDHMDGIPQKSYLFPKAVGHHPEIPVQEADRNVTGTPTLEGPASQLHTTDCIWELIEDNYSVQCFQERAAPRFGGHVYDHYVTVRPFDFSGPLKERSTEEVVRTLLQSIISRLTGQIADHDLVGFVISKPSMRNDISIPLTRRNQLSAYGLLLLIEQIPQSNEELLLLEGGFHIRVVHVQMPEGGRNWENTLPLEKFIKKKQRFLQIQNRDELCCARALVVAMAHANKGKDKAHYQRIRRPKGRFQTEEARLLHKKAGVNEGVCGIPEIEKFQEYLGSQGYQIVVYVTADKYGLIYKGPSTCSDSRMLVLFLHDKHYDVILSLSYFLRRSYFCKVCFKGYDSKDRHRCINTCNCCKQNEGCKLEKWLHCENCNRYFKSQSCFDLHKESSSGSKSICKKIRKCRDCGVLLDKRFVRNHDCSKRYCERCRENVTISNHQCYMKPLWKEETDEEEPDEKKTEEEQKIQKYIFFDFECRQDIEISKNQHGPVYKHIPNLCVAQRVCDNCVHQGDDACFHCGIRKHVFQGDNTADEFCTWLFGEENDDGVIAIAHNARSYDTQFIQDYLVRNAQCPKVILNGSKLLSLTVGKVRVIDSMSFLAMPLSAFPSTFNLKELKKGFFPHLFNRLENQDYDGSMPERNDFDPDGMTEEKRNEFDKWYENHREDRFNLQKELLQYCESDVQILMEGCMRFRAHFMSVTQNIDPFQNITIAAACNTVFRTQFLKPNTIGLIPTQGYRGNDRHSTTALKWLMWISLEEGIEIKHARNGGEHKIKGYKVDGYHAASRTCYEFLGDIWHGCKKCHPRRDTLVPGSNDTVQDVYDQTMQRQYKLKKLGYKVVSMWECGFKKMKKENPKLERFLRELDIVDPIEPRHALYGGRTNAIKLHHKVQGNERIRYIDVCSLYPWVCKYAKYPLGHPIIITENFKPIDQYFGLVKCKVYPPRQLFHPVLPYRNTEGKLLFPLCRTCVEQKQTEKCTHDEEERALSSTWVTEEVKKATELGYRIAKVYEVWDYTDSTQYDPKSQTGGLFSEYINLFLKVKQEASGWPQECCSDDLPDSKIKSERKKYIKTYHEKEGIHLDPTAIKTNKGLRAVGKICLNSFWGKFGQRNNLPKTVYFTNPEEFFKHITNPKFMIKNLDFPNDNMAQVQYVEGDDFLEVLPNTNVVVAAFTTCYARLKLYTYLEKLQQKVLYFDTDSVIYLKDDQVKDIPTGNFLGDMTDELEKDYGQGSYITELYALGPKHYTYKVYSTKRNCEVVGSCKVRGITLNCRNSRLVNFQSCAELLRGQRSHTTVVTPNRITTSRTQGVVSRTETKVHRLVYDKRVRVGDFDTQPYGY